MNFIKQLLIILGFTALGEALAYLIPLPIPAAIYGLVLLLAALGTGFVKTRQVKAASGFLISIMPILFVPVCVRILEYWGVLSQNAAAILTVTVVSTFLVFAVSGRVTQWIMGRKAGRSHD